MWSASALFYITQKILEGKTEQEACDKLAELITSLKNTPYAAAGSTTVDQWFVQWRDTYKYLQGFL